MSSVPPPAPAPGTASPPTMERLLQALGADPAFAESVLGDLAEEYAVRAGRDGAGAARWWYAREALRSAPHLVRSGIRHASWNQRARWAAFVAAGVAVTTTVVLVALLTGNRAPARLVAGAGDAEGVTVNNRWPVPLPMRVLDGAGRPIERSDVAYRWVSGAPVTVSPTGVVTCTERGDATVRASLGLLSTRFLVRCRPIREIRAMIWNDFVLGDPERELPVDFVGLDSLSVTRIAGQVTIRDSTVATVKGVRIRPLSPGRTNVELRVGDEWTSAAVTVFEPVRSLASLRPDQRFVAAPVRLARGESVRWPLPTGLFYLVILPGPEGAAPPVMAVSGAIMCLPKLRPRVYRFGCLARSADALLTVAHPGSSAAYAAGTIALERDARW